MVTMFDIYSVLWLKEEELERMCSEEEGPTYGPEIAS